MTDKPKLVKREGIDCLELAGRMGEASCGLLLNHEDDGWHFDSE